MATTEALGVLWPDAADPDRRCFCKALHWLLGWGLGPAGCNCSTRFVRLLLEGRGYDAEPSLHVYASRGGHCDCEVLMNTAQFHEHEW
jgi:hypothetical protein